MEKDPESFKTDSTIVTKIITEDTTIFVNVPVMVELPKDTVRIVKKLPCKINPIDDIYQRNGIIYMKLSIRNNTIHAESWLDSTFIYQLQDSITVKDGKITYLKTVTKEQIVIIEESKTFKEKLKYYTKITIIAFSIIGFAAIIYIIRKKKLR